MREQQRRILDALIAAGNGGSLNLQAEFLTFEDLLDCARQTTDLLGIVNADLNKSTIQSWLRLGILRDSDKKDRPIRNRLYSAVDVIRLATVRELVHMGIRAKGAAEIADGIVEALATDWFLRTGELNPSPELDARDLIWVVPGEQEGMCGLWNIRPDETQTRANELLVSNLKIHGVAIVVNARTIVHLSVQFVGEKYKQRARDWKDKLEAQMARVKARKQEA